MKNDLLARDEASVNQSSWPVYVVFTTVQNTLLSLQTAGRFTSDLAARIQLLVPDRVKHPQVFVTPMVLADFTVRYYQTMISPKNNLQIKLTLYPAESKDLWEVVPPQSFIFLTGARRRFWPSPEQRWAHQLQQAGHEVVFSSTQLLTTDSSILSKAKKEVSKWNFFGDYWKHFVPRFRLT